MSEDLDRDLVKLARVAVALGAADCGGPLSAREAALVDRAEGQPVDPTSLRLARKKLAAGEDWFGDVFTRVKSAADRRVDGAVYTPALLVDPMVTWTLDQDPQRVVDAGAGSGRFAAAVLRQRPDIEMVAVDLDPVATLMTRATLSVLGAPNVRVLQRDFTRLRLPKVDGRTAYLGNPPYVRHHQLTPETKAWAQTTAKAMGLKLSGLSGLHVLFYLATAASARAGDVGCYVTSSEWLDVNYGRALRELLLDQLGGESVHVVEPTALPFEGTQTTAVVTTFRVGEQPASVRMRAIETTSDVKDLATAGQPVARQRLAEAPRWSPLLRTAVAAPQGYVELGELCRVHRGTVTGANATWVRRHWDDLPESVLFASVTKARELFAARTVLSDATALKRVVDIPSDLDELEPAEKRQVERFIKAAKAAGVHKGYIASHRRAWWSVGLKAPAPLLATYMARQVPAFVENAAEARHINVAHGLYPREPMDRRALVRLAESLRNGVTLGQGRVYAGGLTKFEPKEMERLLVPDLATLRSHEPLPAAVDA